MVKLVDTPASGAGGRKAVEVQVLSWAPYKKTPSKDGVFLYGALTTVGTAAR